MPHIKFISKEKKMGFILFIIIVIALLWVKQNLDVMKLYQKGMTSEQKAIIRYMFGGFLVFGKMKDVDYDQLVRNKVDGFKFREAAISKIGLDEDQISEIPPVNFQGFDCDEESKTAIRFIGKQDGKLRSTEYEVVWLFFSDSQVYMYKCHFDMLSDTKKVNTEEYFYKDITNFSTASETVPAEEIKISLFGKKGTGKVVNKEYTRFGLIVPGDKFYCSTTNTSNVDEAISGMKQKLREKKNA